MLVRAMLFGFLVSGLAHAGEPAAASHPQPPVSVGRVQYVQASSLNVHEQPSATAPILFELRINEQVVVVGPAASPDNDWCQVQARQRTGFLTCALVGDVPLTIDALTAVAGDVDAPGEQRTLAWQRLLALLEVELISAGTPVPPALASRAGPQRRRQLRPLRDRPHRRRRAHAPARRPRCPGRRHPSPARATFVSSPCRPVSNRPSSSAPCRSSTVPPRRRRHPAPSSPPHPRHLDGHAALTRSTN